MKIGKINQSFFALKTQHKAAFAVLVDPDSVTTTSMQDIARKCNDAGVDYVFVGGSIMLTNHVSEIMNAFKQVSAIPLVLFPGSPSQVEPGADALLYLSLISGRNPDLLIGQHVVSAPKIKQSGLEVIATGYIVIDGGLPTTVSYMSNAAPIPANKPDIALCTAWAGELQGKHLIYMDAGSGAQHPISKEMISKVAHNIDIPLVIGGGIRTAAKALEVCEAGAQIVVVGNAIESNCELIAEISLAIKAFNSKKEVNA